MTEKPNWEAFGKAVMQSWPDGGIDGFELQDIAEKHRLLAPVPGGFDPTRHNDFYGGAEPGDPWFALNYDG